METPPANIVLDFGKHRGRRLSEVPNAYLGWLTMWKCTTFCCDDDDCEGDECSSNKVSVRRYIATRCESWQSNPDLVCCHCSRCRIVSFLAKQNVVVSAARELATMKRLCCACWSPMPPIGDARVNGAGHADWQGRYLHKSCWRELVR